MPAFKSSHEKSLFKIQQLFESLSLKTAISQTTQLEFENAQSELLAQPITIPKTHTIQNLQCKAYKGRAFKEVPEREGRLAANVQQATR